MKDENASSLSEMEARGLASFELLSVVRGWGLTWSVEHHEDGPILPLQELPEILHGDRTVKNKIKLNYDIRSAKIQQQLDFRWCWNYESPHQEDGEYFHIRGGSGPTVVSAHQFQEFWYFRKITTFSTICLQPGGLWGDAEGEKATGRLFVKSKARLSPATGRRMVSESEGASDKSVTCPLWTAAIRKEFWTLWTTHSLMDKCWRGRQSRMWSEKAASHTLL